MTSSGGPARLAGAKYEDPSHEGEIQALVIRCAARDRSSSNAPQPARAALLDNSAGMSCRLGELARGPRGGSAPSDKLVKTAVGVLSNRPALPLHHFGEV